MASSNPLYWTRDRFFWWQSGTLFHVQRGGIDPSEIYTSTDLPDALEQAGYDESRHDICANEAPDLETEWL